MSDLRLSQKLHVLPVAEDGIINQAIAIQFEINVECESSIITARSTLESFETSAALRKNLTLGDKLRGLHLMDLHDNISLVSRICKINRKTVIIELARRESSLLMRRKELLCM